MKDKKKMVAGVLLIVLLGLASFSIPMIALAYLGDKALPGQVQDTEVMQKVDEQPAINNVVADQELTPKTVAVSNQVSKPVANRVNQAPAPSRSSTNQYSRNLDSLAKLVYGEARGESFVGKVAVAAVVLNRVESGKFGNTVNQVIFEPGAFTAVSDGQYYLKPDQEAYKAAQAALDGWDPTNNAIYYWNPVTATNKWIWSRPITSTIGKHVFAH